MVSVKPSAVSSEGVESLVRSEYPAFLHNDSVGLRKSVIFLSTSELPEFLVDYFILNLPCSFYDSNDFYFSKHCQDMSEVF